VAGPRRVGLWRTGLQAQVSDFRMAPRCVAASLVTKAQEGVRRRRWKRPGFSAPLFRQAGEAELADLSHAGAFHNWGFFLPLCKSSGLSPNCVGASEPLPVLVKHSHLPVMVFSPFVFPECCGFPNFHLEILSRQIDCPPDFATLICPIIVRQQWCLLHHAWPIDS
jgi:hypothetical protein